MKQIWLWPERRALVTIASPWVLVYCIAAISVLVLLSANAVMAQHPGFTLAGFAIALLLLWAAPFVAAVQWARFLATGRKPRFLDVPGATLWRLFCRLVLVTAVFNSASHVGQALKSSLSLPVWAASAVVSTLWFVVLVIISPLALVFVPIALGANDKGLNAAMKGFWPIRRQYYFGAAGMLLPMALVGWLNDITSTVSELSWLATILSLSVFFAVVLVATTGMTKVYLHGNPGAVSAQ